ncbi:hypothetical protein MNBD_PLANCTO02-2965 [hydrothermal vent metagenome]|uniref:Uncharacterized protein n=1 Tax=hydrothermal vent metagenome TaxID=652676 RepID=A0A3B1E3D6_9ZZZZ
MNTPLFLWVGIEIAISFRYNATRRSRQVTLPALTAGINIDEWI